MAGGHAPDALPPLRRQASAPPLDLLHVVRKELGALTLVVDLGCPVTRPLPLSCNCEAARPFEQGGRHGPGGSGVCWPLGRRWGPRWDAARHSPAPLLLAGMCSGRNQHGQALPAAAWHSRPPGIGKGGSLKRRPWLEGALSERGLARRLVSGTRPKPAEPIPLAVVPGGIRMQAAGRRCCCWPPPRAAAVCSPGQPDGGGAGAGACLGTQLACGPTGGPAALATPPGGGGGGDASGPGAVAEAKIGDRLARWSPGPYASSTDVVRWLPQAPPFATTKRWLLSRGGGAGGLAPHSGTERPPARGPR